MLSCLELGLAVEVDVVELGLVFEGVLGGCFEELVGDDE